MTPNLDDLRKKLVEVKDIVKHLNKEGVTINFEISNHKKTIEMDAVPEVSIPFTIEVKKATINTEL